MKTIHRIVGLHFMLSLGTWFLGSYPLLLGGTRHIISVLSREIFTVINFPGALAVRFLYAGSVFTLAPITIVYALGMVLLSEWPVLIIAFVVNRFVRVK